MSTLYIWCELVCDGCSHSTAGRHGAGRLPATEAMRMKNEAVKQGWVFKNNSNFCYDCAAKEES